MSFRFRRSVKLGKAARINVSKTGVGMSAGGKHARVSAHSSGRTTRTVRGPAGAHWRKDSGAGNKTVRAASPKTAPSTRLSSPPKPGLFAPRSEKQLYKAMTGTDLEKLDMLGTGDPSYRQLANLAAGLLVIDSDPERAETYLRAATSEPFADPAVKFVTRCFADVAIDVKLAPGVTLSLPMSRELGVLLLIQLRQHAGDAPGAAGLADFLPDVDPYRLVRAGCYIEVDRYEDVLALTDAVKNEGNATMFACGLRAVALREMGHLDAAKEALKEALKSKARDEDLRRRLLFERARTHLDAGHRGRARKDLERILAEDSSFEGVRELLEQLEE
jgi:tetratricopeptide (TPR) repeat protein